MRLSLTAVITLAFSMMTVPSFCQSDAEKFTEGRIALDKYHDCPAAKAALQQVSNATKSNPIWVLYMAKTNECLGALAEALSDYEQYDRLIPGQAEIVDKIGDLRYKVSKLNGEETRRQAYQQALVTTKPLLEEVARKLNSLGSRTVQTSEGGKRVRKVSYKASGGGCTLGVNVEEDDTYKGKSLSSGADAVYVQFASVTVDPYEEDSGQYQSLSVSNVRAIIQTWGAIPADTARSHTEDGYRFDWLPSKEFASDLYRSLNKASSICKLVPGY